MNKHDNQLAISVVATLIAGIALIYTLIMFPKTIFAVAGISLVFVACAFLLTKNILSYSSSKEQQFNNQINESIQNISSQIETMGNSQAQIEKATFLYTKQTAKTLSTLENNYIESQEALYKNLESISNAQNKSTKLMLKYDQNNTTKVISTLKELRTQLNETMSQGFEQVKPNNSDIVDTLEDIVNYLKSQPIGVDQSMSLQLNNVAHELQNISNSIQNVQVNMPTVASMPVQTTVVQPVAESVTESVAEPAVDPVADPVVDIEEAITEAATEETATEETTNEIPPVSEEPIENMITEDDTSEGKDHLDASDLDALFASLSEDVADEEEEPFTPTFTVVGKESEEVEPEPVEPESAESEPVAVTPLSDDPNKQLSADEIAALFAAAEPSPKKEEKPAEPEPEPVAVTPLSDDPNKQLSADEIAALFAAAEPSPKKEEKPAEPEPEPVAVTPLSDDPNKQLSPDEIAALFASIG